MKLSLYLFLLISLNLSVFAQNEKTALAKVRAEKALQVFSQFSALGSDSLPFQLFKRAKAIAVFGEIEKKQRFLELLSKTIKGNGLLVFREEKEWTAPTFLTCGGMEIVINSELYQKDNFGAVFLFMNDKAVQIIKKGNLRGDKITGDEMALGPLIKGKGADSTIEKAAILYYTFDDNKLSGEELKNTKIGTNFRILHDDGINKIIYGKKFKAIMTEKTELAVVPEIEKFRQIITESLERN